MKNQINKRLDKCMLKNKLNTKVKKNPTSENNNKYKAYKDKIICIKRSSERMYYSQLVENNKSNGKDTLNVLRSINKK